MKEFLYEVVPRIYKEIPRITEAVERELSVR
jgi:hypothetical protein